MKKRISILILFCLCSYSAISQIKIEKATITLPTQAKKLTKKERNETLDKKLKVEELIANADAENNYEVDGMLLTFNGYNVDGNRNYLKGLELSKKNRKKSLGITDKYFYISNITINGNQILLDRNKAAYHCYYNFFVVNSDFTYSIRGSLRYLEGEETKSRAIIDQILTNIIIK
ncbi:hypothetical protein [Pedobacter sp. MC2016-24]|uniref:hypothetical protein n=1 Tax=Pedobacter sp. MC2016-24 TaxID=2780090 RepID=UPI001880A182|nr:hypothetical protein [Pedobacter sp. MC2016-24]MBE9603186.1 hypothetical protein [Pedobacter sp. MC2016-24]